MIFIPKENIDPTYWINNINNFTYNTDSNIKLNIGDYVCIQIINKRINQYDTQIKTIGKLLDLPTSKHVEKYFGKNIDDLENTLNEQESNFI
jgi:hypothetical protein